jgi:hypothetical protein
VNVPEEFIVEFLNLNHEKDKPSKVKRRKDDRIDVGKLYS